MNYSEEKNQILRGLAASPVVKPTLNNFTKELLEEMAEDYFVKIIRDENGGIISFSITNEGRDFLAEGGY